MVRNRGRIFCGFRRAGRIVKICVLRIRRAISELEREKKERAGLRVQ